jgi:hypothetical protein
MPDFLEELKIFPTHSVFSSSSPFVKFLGICRIIVTRRYKAVV